MNMSDQQEDTLNQVDAFLMGTEDNNFDMECSDEEFRPKDGVPWEPLPDEIAELFDRIDRGVPIDIEWTTPGRRPPTPTPKFDSQNEEDNVDEHRPEEKSDFDFQDEMSNLKLSAKAIRPVGSEAGPRGSAKKKTVSLDAILSNMARHRKLDMMEDDDEDPLP
ncbi:PAXIP1-associated glutamate-rich protein 1 [Macrosteles quadrilineatus]|uniref:PAXIP1-associated glutamate-rich protein 1 n=1 Tax=Macrosteles quadrilineatus TaxID=74068 RepID=UPI0023E19695|nr:PAXIP1-associated glutamate-rich protein 1 [Macrosteles quadrilineatus]